MGAWLKWFITAIWKKIKINYLVTNFNGMAHSKFEWNENLFYSFDFHFTN